VIELNVRDILDLTSAVVATGCLVFVIASFISVAVGKIEEAQSND
jgi:hypothetical protein